MQVRRSRARMDEAFYSRMLARYEEGELDEEELSLMLDSHLHQVEEFEAQLRDKLRRRRKQRQVRPLAGKIITSS